MRLATLGLTIIAVSIYASPVNEDETKLLTGQLKSCEDRRRERNELKGIEIRFAKLWAWRQQIAEMEQRGERSDLPSKFFAAIDEYESRLARAEDKVHAEAGKDYKFPWPFSDTDGLMAMDMVIGPFGAEGSPKDILYQDFLAMGFIFNTVRRIPLARKDLEPSSPFLATT